MTTGTPVRDVMSTRTIARSAVWSSLEAAGTAGLQLLSLVVLARLLGPLDLGLGMLAIAIVYTLNALVPNFFAKAIIQRDPLEAAHLDTAFWGSLGAAVGMIALCLIGADRVAAFFAEPELGPLLRWMCPLLALGAFNGIMISLLRKTMQFGHIAVATLISRVVGSVVAIGMALAGFGVWSLVGQQLGLFGGSAVALWYTVTWRPGFSFSWRHVRELSSFAGPSALSRILTAVSDHVFAVMAGHLFGTVGLGYVALAGRISSTLGDIIGETSRQITFSVFSLQQRTPGALTESVYGATRLTCLLAVPIFVGLALCAHDIVDLVFGSRWDAAVPLVQLFAVGCIFRVAVGPIQTAVEAVGRPGWHLVRGTVQLVANIVGLLVLAPMGAIATGVVVVVVSMLTTPIDFFVARRFIDLHGRVLATRLRWPLVASGLMGTLLVAPKLTVMTTWPTSTRLLGLASLGVLLYVGILWAGDRQLVRGTVSSALAGFGRRQGSSESLGAPIVSATPTSEEVW